MKGKGKREEGAGVLEELAQKLTAADQPDVLAGMAAKLGEPLGWVAGEKGKSPVLPRLLAAREDVVLDPGKEGLTRRHLLHGVVRFAAHDGCVHRGEEARHAVILVHEQPVDRPVGAGDEAVEAVGTEVLDTAHARKYTTQ